MFDSQRTRGEGVKKRGTDAEIKKIDTGAQW